MPSTLDMNTLLNEAMTWSPEDRLEAAERLVASVPCDPVIERAQIEEVHRRIAEDRSGKTIRIPGQAALDQVRQAVLRGS